MPNRSPKYIIKTLNAKNKERILKTARERDQLPYKGRPIRLTPDFSTEILKVRRVRTDVLQTLRNHRCQPRLLYPAKLLSTIDRESKAFHERTKLKATTPSPQEALEGKLQSGELVYTQEDKRSK